jgi:hypothetical protein
LFSEKVFSLRPSAYLGGLGGFCGNGYLTAERAEIRREPQRRNGWLRLCWAAYLSALCGEITVTAEDRRDTQRAAEKTFQEDAQDAENHRNYFH